MFNGIRKPSNHIIALNWVIVALRDLHECVSPSAGVIAHRTEHLPRFHGHIIDGGVVFVTRLAPTAGGGLSLVHPHLYPLERAVLASDAPIGVNLILVTAARRAVLIHRTCASRGLHAQRTRVTAEQREILGIPARGHPTGEIG